jgi:hypothetical protein
VRGGARCGWGSQEDPTHSVQRMGDTSLARRLGRRVAEERRVLDTRAAVVIQAAWRSYHTRRCLDRFRWGAPAPALDLQTCTAAPLRRASRATGAARLPPSP